MAITPFQRQICQLIAANRKSQDSAYVAGGVALNLLLNAPRLSLDIDLFHDTREALEATWDADRRLLEDNGYGVDTLRERPAFVEATVAKDSDRVTLQWTCDSAYRFFPLVEHPDLGLTMHPFDLATNKVLAMAGRLEPRDWIDVIECHAKVQPLGYLAWAACGKDAGFSPTLILQEARRSSHYSAEEIAELAFDTRPPDAAALSAVWREALSQAAQIVDRLPAEQVGKCVIDENGRLYCDAPGALAEDLSRGVLLFRNGSIRGAFPQIAG